MSKILEESKDLVLDSNKDCLINNFQSVVESIGEPFNTLKCFREIKETVTFFNNLILFYKYIIIQLINCPFYFKIGTSMSFVVRKQ